MSSEEQWLPVVGWEDRYQVSSLGRVRAIFYIDDAGGKRKPHYLSTRVGCPYVRVNFKRNGQNYPYSVHVLVAEAFLGPRPEGLEVNHKNGNKADNRLENLEYVTHLENILHARDQLGVQFGPNGTRSQEQILSICDDLAHTQLTYAEIAKKHDVSKRMIRSIKNADRHTETVHNAGLKFPKRGHKLTENSISQIRALLESGLTQMAIAKRFGISQCFVSQIKTGTRWRAD